MLGNPQSLQLRVIEMGGAQYMIRGPMATHRRVFVFGKYESLDLPGGFIHIQAGPGVGQELVVRASGRARYLTSSTASGAC